MRAVYGCKHRNRGTTEFLYVPLKLAALIKPCRCSNGDMKIKMAVGGNLQGIVRAIERGRISLDGLREGGWNVEEVDVPADIFERLEYYSDFDDANRAVDSGLTLLDYARAYYVHKNSY